MERQRQVFGCVGSTLLHPPVHQRELRSTTALSVYKRRGHVSVGGSRKWPDPIVAWGDGSTTIEVVIRNARYLLLLALVLLLALAGYAGYVLYPRFDLPAATGVGLLILAAGAGLASFFSPCSFPLLATLLARQVRDVERAEAWARLLRFGAALAAGAALFLLLVGAAIALGAAPLFERVTFTSTAGRVLRLMVGGLLVLLGLLQWRGISPASGAVYQVARPLMEAQARLRRERPTLAFGLFGFGYILASFG